MNRRHIEEATNLIKDYEEIPDTANLKALVHWCCKVVLFLLVRYIDGE